MSILGENRIREILICDDIINRLIITPLLNEEQISESSVDIRLGDKFTAIRKGNIEFFDPAKEDVIVRNFESKHILNFGEEFVLHPNELVLADTLEYFRLPQNLAGYVTSRSSWGRTGLVIATATVIHPGYKGCITLELINLGGAPIKLYPGLAIAQIVLSDCEDAENYDGQFSLTTDGSHGAIYKDDAKFWVDKDNFT